MTFSWNMFALLRAANTGSISFGETYSVSGDVHNPVSEDVGGAMVFTKTEQQVTQVSQIALSCCDKPC